MPHCYLVALCGGASLDQGSNNISLFNLVEQINLPPADAANAPRPARIPLEVHAYAHFEPHEVGGEFEFRYALVSETGLDVYSDPITHSAKTPRFRTRSLGLPLPVTLGQYHLHIEFRRVGEEDFRRDPLAWPIQFQEQRPTVTH